MLHDVTQPVLADGLARQKDGAHQEVLKSSYHGEKAEMKGVFQREKQKEKDAVQNFPCLQHFPDVIIIEDDDGNSEVENHDGQVGMRRSQSHYASSSSGDSLDDSSLDTSELSDRSDEEDCVVVEPHVPRPFSTVDNWFKTKKRPRRPAVELFESKKKRSDSSDCEIIVDHDGKVRQHWEEAALRRRMAYSRQRAESEESTSVSNHANSDTGKSQNVNQNGEGRPHVRRSWEQRNNRQFGTGISAFEAGSAHVTRKEEAFDQQGSNMNDSDAGLGDTTEEASSRGDSLGHDVTGFQNLEPGTSADQFCNDEEACERMVTNKHVGAHVEPLQATEANATLASVSAMVADRERLKNTEEFQLADEEEWTRRHLELQKQAEEAQRERKRRKLEAERKREMEVRQRRRLEEIRQSQLKDEQTSDIKAQMRGRIQAELERVAAPCRDMTTLLRRLGVPVDGGLFPTTEQVTAAYKKALLRFHPDRASGLAKNDPAYQVEAEEKFKLVSRMKETLPLRTTNFY